MIFISFDDSFLWGAVLCTCKMFSMPAPSTYYISVASPPVMPMCLEGENHLPALPCFRTTILENLHPHSIVKLDAYSHRPVTPANAKTWGLYRLAHEKEQKAKFLSATEGEQFIWKPLLKCYLSQSVSCKEWQSTFYFFAF